MHKILISTTLLVTTLFAHLANTNVNTYFESTDFKNSVQKYDAKIIGVGAQTIHGDSLYKLTYEHGETNTKKPPLDKDLKLDKLFLKYGHKLDSKWSINLNYLNVLNDNIAITAHGKAYGLGLTYNFSKMTSLNFTQFLSDYKDFNVAQSDISLNHTMKLQDIKFRFTAISKTLHLEDKDSNSFSKNAKSDYSSVGFKLHSHYDSYHLGFGAYYGKRAFAIMQDGFKIQHHAMEFDRTISGGFGKSFDKLTLKLQYVYQRATELPAQNGKKVDVKNTRVMANYKF